MTESEVRQIKAEALREAADFIADTAGIGASQNDYGRGWYGALDYAVTTLRDRAAALATAPDTADAEETDDQFWGRLLGDDDPAAPNRDWRAAAFNSGPVHLEAEPRCEGLAPFRCGNPSCPAHPKENPDA